MLGFANDDRETEKEQAQRAARGGCPSCLPRMLLPARADAERGGGGWGLVTRTVSRVRRAAGCGGLLLLGRDVFAFLEDDLSGLRGGVSGRKLLVGVVS